MLPSINSYSILYTLFARFLGVCYGFVLLSSAAGQNGDISLFEIGESLTYHFHSTVLLNEKDQTYKNVGFYIAGDVVVQSIWGDSEKLLRIELKSPQLNIKSRKAPLPDGFVPHSSDLDNLSNKPFLIVWSRGKVNRIFLPKGEEISLTNVKKGIASLFQFQLLDGKSTETDTSGHCTTEYTSLSPSKILKTKTDCVSREFSYVKNPDEILGVKVDSQRETEYQLHPSNSYLKSINSKENHKMYLPIKAEIGNCIEASQILNFVKREDTSTVEGDTIENAIENISKSTGITYVEKNLLTEKEPLTAEDDKLNFAKLVDTMRDYLKTENLGSLKITKAFIRLINVARSSTKEDILKALESKKNKDILYQLYDVLGYTQTKESHEAAIKKLHFDKESQIDLSERYLWALSLSSQPNPDIIKYLLKKYTKLINIPDKVKETLILTIASMTYKLSNLQLDQSHSKLIKDVQELIINNLEYAKNEERYAFFRALQNLKSKSTIPLLLKYIKKGTQKEGVLSWRALKSFDSKFWNKNVLQAAKNSLFQLDRKYDSSSRAISADILIESQPDDDLLEDLLNFIVSDDPAFEIKQYVFQRIKMLADEDDSFKERTLRIIKKDRRINNYSGLSPRGLSTALTREFFRSASSNGSLVSVQELKNGIVKRGIVNVIMQKDSVVKEIFSLGIFSGGLSSFVSSDGDKDEEEESATAGMELSVLGTQIRPFVFFDGQGELMGHVWSGTASEKTPAFQALILLQDHLEYIRIGSGFIAEFNVKGATSFDLSGKIEISLWNRNAESLVEKSAGIVVIGEIIVNTAFVKSQIEFHASIEPKLNLQTDIDFSSNVHLCMRLTQPDSVFRYNIFKVERIPNSKHRLRISQFKKSIVPGKTYSLNKKNNEMCSAIFS